MGSINYILWQMPLPHQELKMQFDEALFLVTTLAEWLRCHSDLFRIKGSNPIQEWKNLSHKKAVIGCLPARRHLIGSG